MIDLRYHVVSLVAVFLALSLGILLGSSVVRSPLDAQLNEDLQKRIDERDEAKAAVREFQNEHDALINRLSGPIADWAVHDRLDQTTFVLVADAADVPFRDHVLDALVAAGAEPRGSLTFTERMDLAAPEDSEELVTVVTDVVPTFRPSDAAGVDALGLLGTRFGEPTGPALVTALVDAGFATLQGEGDEDWPPSGAMVVMLSRTVPDDEARTRPLPGIAAFARGTAASAVPTLVASDTSELPTVLTLLRAEERLPNSLATFDSATTTDDPGGIGLVAALVAASEGRGGHFGSGEGLDFVAPPPSSE